VEKYSLICLADTEDVTNLRALPALDVPQADDRPLARWQSLDRLRDELACLFSEEPVLG
jgi:hypothetical protein